MQTGLDTFLSEGLPQLAQRRVGLITNHTGVDRHLRSGIDLLHASSHLELVALFGPEHGVRGAAQAGVKVGASVDARTGLPVHSLYGVTRRLTPGMLGGLDALIFDLQDVGVRYFTYISTMAYAQQVAADAGVDFVVFDRPNPITGSHVEGNLLDPAFASFVGIHPLPIRHGMTVGELARLFAAERGWPEPLVVMVQGWRRELWFDQTDLIWVQPSPNLPMLDSVTLYAGTCLIEGTNLSEGRGTTRPFELIGAPWIDPYQLAERMQSLNLPGVLFRPVYFTPTFSKHANKLCAGVQIHIIERETVRPVELGVRLLHALRALDPASFAWQQNKNRQFFIDLLLGGDQPRLALDRGAGADDVLAGWDQAAQDFRQRRQPFLLYV